MTIAKLARRLLLLVTIACVPAVWAAETMVPAAPQLAAKAWILMDANSGAVLTESNSDQRLPPASLTHLRSWHGSSCTSAAARKRSGR